MTDPMRDALERMKADLRVDDPHGHYDMVCDALASSQPLLSPGAVPMDLMPTVLGDTAQQAGPAGSVAHGCHLEADNGEPVADDCVLDYGMPDDCSHCQRNKIERREDCEHWRPLKMAELPSAPPAAPVVPEEWRQAIECEPELPDAMPDEMWAAIKDDRDAATEAMRLAVRFTKAGILARLSALLAAPAPERVREVGCETTDGMLKIHPDSETCEVCAPEQREKVELTDAEIEERWWGELDNRSLSSIRAVLAAYEAKQKGGTT